MNWEDAYKQQTKNLQFYVSELHKSEDQVEELQLQLKKKLELGESHIANVMPSLEPISDEEIKRAGIEYVETCIRYNYEDCVKPILISNAINCFEKMTKILKANRQAIK